MDLMQFQYYNHIAKYMSKGMVVMKKSLMGIIDLKPSLKCEQSVVIEYYIIEDENTDEDYDDKKPYGIEVMKKQLIDGIVYREIKTVKHISSSIDYVKGVADLLKKNSVTPITTGDVLEDLAVK